MENPVIVLLTALSFINFYIMRGEYALIDIANNIVIYYPFCMVIFFFFFFFSHDHPEDLM